MRTEMGIGFLIGSVILAAMWWHIDIRPQLKPRKKERTP